MNRVSRLDVEIRNRWIMVMGVVIFLGLILIGLPVLAAGWGTGGEDTINHPVRSRLEANYDVDPYAVRMPKVELAIVGAAIVDEPTPATGGTEPRNVMATVRNNLLTPIPTITPMPPGTGTPRATPTPRVGTPTPTFRPTASRTLPRPTATPEPPTATPRPGDTATPTPSPTLTPTYLIYTPTRRPPTATSGPGPTQPPEPTSPPPPTATQPPPPTATEPPYIPPPTAVPPTPPYP